MNNTIPNLNTSKAKHNEAPTLNTTKRQTCHENPVPILNNTQKSKSIRNHSIYF